MNPWDAEHGLLVGLSRNLHDVLRRKFTKAYLCIVFQFGLLRKCHSNKTFGQINKITESR